MPDGVGHTEVDTTSRADAGEPPEGALRRTAWVLGLLMAALGCAVLAGWWLDVPSVTRVVGDFTPMKPNAALGVAVGGLGIAAAAWVPQRPWTRPAVHAAGVLLIAVGGLTLLQVATGADLELDTWLLPAGADADSPHPGRMAHLAAAVFIAIGAGLLAVTRGRRPLADLLAFAAVSVGYVALLGYLYGVSSLYQVGAYSGMAVHMAGAACVLAVGLELCMPDHGLATLLRDKGGAGRITRTLMPTVAIVVPLIGWLVLRGQNSGWYNAGFSAAVIVASVGILGSALTLRAAVHARRSDERRDSALRSLEELTHTLEDKVTERTAAAAAVARDLIAVFDAAPVGMLRLDSDGRCFGANARWRQMSGLTLADSLNAGWLNALHPDDRPEVRHTVTVLDEYAPVTCRVLTPEGPRTALYAVRAGVPPANGQVSYIATFSDIHAETEARRALEAARARVSAAFDASSMGIALVGLDGTILEANQRLGELTGVAPQRLVGRRFADLLAAEWARAEEELRSALLGAHRSYGSLECELSGPPGNGAWVLANVALVDTQPVGPQYFVTELQDITARKLADERLAHAALHDALTGLPNRMLVMDRLTHALRRAERAGTSVGLLFVDVDHFKVVNDRLGHHAGDEVLRIVGDRILRAARPSDTVSRFGGDEFVIVCEDLSAISEIVRVAERFRRAIAAPIIVGGVDLTVDVSIGVAMAHTSSVAPDGLLRDADAAMYDAKAQGRGRCVVFDERMRSRLTKWITVETGLSGAVRRGEVLALYQPIVRLQSGAVVGVEALARWQPAGHELMTAAEFIPVAEDTGLIAEIGDHVLQLACVTASAWRCAERGIRMSVNVSAHQLLAGAFADNVMLALSTADLDPSVLCLELTESVLIEAADAVHSLQELREQGVHVAIDDFGVGFSSLGYLRRFPVDVLKIDKVFVDGMLANPRDAAIVTGIVHLGRSLGMDVVVEGIEERAQLTALVELGCELGQGHLFSAAASADEVLDPRRSRLSPNVDNNSAGV
jgi:diguanylate cyclase (GGDEF)-like protein/PAS domain S-box-containing protein